MIDIESIKQNYSNMLDSQLLNVLKQDGLTLMPEAYEALKSEFQKRHLDLSHFEVIEEQKKEIHAEEIQRIKESDEKDRKELLWNYILDEKENQTPDKLILQGLTERGLSPEEASKYLLEISDKLKETISDAQTQIYIGAAVFTLGILITLLTYASASQHGGSYLITWGAIVFGVVRLIKGTGKKKRYTDLLKKINTTEN